VAAWRIYCERYYYNFLFIFFNYQKGIVLLYFHVGGHFISGELANMLLVASAADIKELCLLVEIYIFSSVFIGRGSAVLSRGRVTVDWSAVDK
jgi:hypothetical protein